MDEFTKEEVEERKKAIFDSMSPRRRKHLLKKGIESWDPFIEPKDPIDIRKDKTKRTSQMLVREFLQAKDMETYSNEYGRGVFDICMGIINNDERCKAMFEFSCWYYELLKREGYSKGDES